MTDFGRALLERAGVTRDVMPRPELVPAQPSYARVKRTAIGPDDGPYRSGAASSELVVGVNLGVPWVVVALLALFVFGTAFLLTAELGVDRRIAFGVGAVAFVALAAWARVRMRAEVRVDGEGLYATGGGRVANLPRKRLIAVETWMIRTRPDQALDGMGSAGMPVDATWLTTFQVRARTDDGTVHELIDMPSIEDCWWLQAQLEAALAVPASIARVVA